MSNLANNYENNDLIAAIATPYGNGAIGIVRISGPHVLTLIKKCFKTPGGGAFKSHRMYYGHIVDFDTGEMIDEVMVCPMLAPRSFTMEDSAEIYAHGGTHVLSKVLDTVIRKGARLAEPGEFTKRAFLNGRINLAQAEAVMDLIHSTTDLARRASLKQLGGGLSQRINAIRDQLLGWIANIELSIDYPEHEDEAKNTAHILQEGTGVIAALDALCRTAQVGRMLQEGVKTAIIGRPNAGKSTLLNSILKEDRAIVHESAGTTRDILTEKVVVGQLPLLLMDTAGLRETTDPIEQIGVEKTQAAFEEAELVLYLVDSTQGLTPKDQEVLSQLGRKPHLILATKADLPQATTIPGGIKISAHTGEGLEALYAQIQSLFLKSQMVPPGTESAWGMENNHAAEDMVTRKRHRLLLEQAAGHVKKAMEEITLGVVEDLVSINLKLAYQNLGEILGLEVADDILDRIFAEFCLGK